IIGARDASEDSLRICSDFTRQLAAKGTVIVSGFAAGIDRCAHKACIDAHGRTIAVLGCGIGFDYPFGSLELQELIRNNGVVISEFPPLSKPVRENFPRRNRLIAALSEKLLVVQASGRSGCLNTVSHALEQGKEVYVIPPHDIRSPLYQGQCALIRDGAHIAFEPQDLF
ncbi:MAG: DNA-protecting protein DprA, partial [Ruminococcus sp.]|nr:DNA-protecting protein DprA [Ruminococcus sp.]